MEFPLKEALGRMFVFSAGNGARHVFLATSSPFIKYHRDKVVNDITVNSAILQRGIFHEIVNAMRCRNSTYAMNRVLVSIVDYHKLVWPDFDELANAPDKCDQSGPNFERKMDDDRHPNFGPGGWYLAHQLQEVLYSGMARQGTQSAKLYEGLVGCNTKHSPAEHLKSPSELLSTTEICVNKLSQPPHQFERIVQPQNVKIELLSGEKDVYMCHGFALENMWGDGIGM